MECHPKPIDELHHFSVDHRPSPLTLPATNLHGPMFQPCLMEGNRVTQKKTSLGIFKDPSTEGKSW